MKAILPLCGTILVFLASCSDKSTESMNVAAEKQGEVRINGQVVSAAQFAEFERVYRVRPKAGNYWYDATSGLYGTVGQPALGFMLPGHNFGALAENVSAGDTSVFVNGRRLPQSEWLIWSTFLGAAIQPGRYWLDAKGNAGYEGVAIPVVNLYQAAAQAAQNRGGASGGGNDNTWSTRFSAGNYNADNSQGYVSVPGVGVIGSYGF